ncbi:unnamed protein product [Mytilus coruscus]|uniref:Uncharacterized protein n=1 Tax=Mytilus coruscus TaxID=42192 RepID=A0A6J8ECW3_MYTCO|nr:unnamed protein product [Mytilus coruscus]
MLDDWSNGNIEDVFRNINMDNQIFRQKFLLHIKGLKIYQQKQLANTYDSHTNSTPLIQRCFKGDIDVVKWCLHHCISNVNHCRIGGASPLFMACQEGHAEVVHILINNKAEVNKCNNKEISPLFIACQKEHTEVVQMLTKNKRDINKCNDKNVSHLDIVYYYGHTVVVQMLVNNKADINKCRKTGESPILIACYKVYTEIVELLLKHKADCNIKWRGITPLNIARQENHTNIVHLLQKQL